MGPLKVAHLNGLSVSRPPLHSDLKDEPERASNDERVRLHFPTSQTSRVWMDGWRAQGEKKGRFSVESEGTTTTSSP